MKNLKFLKLIKQIYCGKNHAIATAIDRKTVYGWGSNHYNQLGFNGDLVWHTPIKIAHLKQAECIRIICGSFHTFAMSYNSPCLEPLNALKAENVSFKNNLERDFQKLSLEHENVKREKDILEQKLKLQQSEIDQLKLELRRKKS